MAAIFTLATDQIWLKSIPRLHQIPLQVSIHHVRFLHMMIRNTLDKLSNGDHVTLIALGDSTTEETFFTQGRMNWVSLLSEALAETYGPGCATLINAGKSGDTAGGVLDRLGRDVLGFGPDMVIMALGLNDALGGKAHLKTFIGQAKQIINHIQNSIGADILICTPNPPLPAKGMLGDFPGRPDIKICPEGFEACVQVYAKALIDLAQEQNLPAVNHWETWNQVKKNAPLEMMLRMADAIHPGPLGHLAFFRELAPLFEVPETFKWEEAGKTESIIHD